jgi:UDP-glucose 4-epimerase
MKQPVLVTGGAGFVGANLVRLLLAKGYAVSVFDNFDKGKEAYLDGLDVRVVRGDIRDADAVGAALKGHDAVFHLAAYGSVIESIADPDTNFQINVVGTLNLLKAAVAQETRKVIFSSTGGALMGNTVPPVSERSVPRPISPYGASKLACEGYLCAFAEAYGLNTLMFRFANVYGPWSAHKQGVFNKYLVAIDRAEPLIVYGESVRDFIYVEDLVTGLVLGLEAETKAGDVFHLATNTGIRIDHLAREMLAIRRRNESEVIYKPGRKGEVVENFAENTKARAELGFRADTDLRVGLTQTFDWFDEHAELWKQKSSAT